ncbi:MAG: ABC transporter substrate-binding protein [Anaerolineae bacterium]
MRVRKRQNELLAAFTLLLLIMLSACGTVDTESPETKGGTLVYGLTLAPSGIDPHIDASSELGIPLTSVYDTLVYQDLDGSFVPGLAERWEVSQDGRTYTFYLRQDVKFHDGAQFDADAVKFNLDRVADPETISRKARGMLGPYNGTEVLDKYTVKIHFDQPYAPFLDSLSQVYLGMASPTAVQKWGAEYQLHQVGTGPFIFHEYVPNDHLTLVRNPDYAWAPSVYSHDGPAYLDEIIFRFYVDPAVRALALESGEADVMGEIPPMDAARIEGNPEFSLIRVAIPGQPLQFFLNTEHPPTDDPLVREAILYATDQTAIVDTIFRGYSPPAHGPLSAATMGYSDKVEGLYPHDPAQAETLLQDAGWIDTNGDGIRESTIDGTPLALRGYLMSWGYLPEVGQLLQSQLAEIGIDLQTELVAFPAAVEAAGQGLHNLAPMTFSGSDPALLGTTYLSANAEGGFNWSKMRDTELDRLLTSALTELDPSDRLALYEEAQIRIMDLSLVLPIRDYVNLNAARASVRGLRYDRQGWFPWLYDTYLDEQ